MNKKLNQAKLAIQNIWFSRCQTMNSWDKCGHTQFEFYCNFCLDIRHRIKNLPEHMKSQIYQLQNYIGYVNWIMFLCEHFRFQISIITYIYYDIITVKTTHLSKVELFFLYSRVNFPSLFPQILVSGIALFFVSISFFHQIHVFTLIIANTIAWQVRSMSFYIKKSQTKTQTLQYLMKILMTVKILSQE